VIALLANSVIALLVNNVITLQHDNDTHYGIQQNDDNKLTTTIGTMAYNIRMIMTLTMPYTG